MKKKITTMMLIAAMSLSLMACGGGSSEPETKAPETKAAASEATAETEQLATETESTSKSVSLAEEIVIADNDECTVKITGIDPDNVWGYTLNAYLENKSSDKTYMFAVEYAAINGVQTDPLFATEVAAGKKTNAEISFFDENLEKNNIGDFTDIEISFIVYDTDNWADDYVADEIVHIYPYGEENAVTFTREAQNSDNVILDNEYATVIVTGYEDDDIWGYTANLFIINKTDKDIMFSVEDASVNGYMADPYFATVVTAGKCEFTSISWDDETLEENGITEIEEIEFSLDVYDNDDWTSYSNETITLNP